MKIKRRSNPSNRTSQKWKCGNCGGMNRKTHTRCVACETRK